MCGFVGIAMTSPIENRAWLGAGLKTLAHRGPDDQGEWWSNDGLVGLAHRRLSIIDLSTHGHQPMQDLTGKYTVAFNGEIYNHQELRTELALLGFEFRTRSDTEVLLAAYAQWGEACLDRLNGMFAFALYDQPYRRLFLARDRAGEKPLFYHYANGQLRFASELKALLQDRKLSRRINADALDSYLALGFVPGEQCILEGFNKLPPSHSMYFNMAKGQITIKRYWSIPPYTDTRITSDSDEEELLEELEHLLEAAVRRQLAADVPVGMLLSGGLDSSLITAMAVRSSDQVRTFTIGFSGHGKLDETEHARLIARHFKTEHTELTAKPSTAELIPVLATQFDEPLVDSSMIPTFLVSQLVRGHCTVALGGDGGDELFGGYDHYSRYLWMQQKLSVVPALIRRAIAVAAHRFLPVGMRGKTYLQDISIDFDRDLPVHIPGFFDRFTRSRLLRDTRLKPAKSAAKIYAQRVPIQADIVQRSTRMDFENYLADDLLVKVDRTSMLNSLEIRSPMLDRELVEFAFGRVPSHLKVSDGNKKILLKKLAARILPPQFDRHRKQGFSIPLGDWLARGPYRDLFHDVLHDPSCIFDRSTVTDLLRGQDKGRYNGERLFALVQFELWRRQYNVSL